MQGFFCFFSWLNMEPNTITTACANLTIANAEDEDDILRVENVIESRIEEESV